MKPPLASDEPERLKALQSYEILDTEAEQQYDDITFLASRICGTPIAMISLVDETRQWFKSKVGVHFQETSRDTSFCAHGILGNGIFVVKDALEDERFATNPLVTGEAHIRFYAGAPLRTSDGHNLGMICVNDRVPRDLTVEQMEALRALSRQVVAQFELKRNLHELQQTFAHLNATRETLQLLSSAVEQSKESILITDAELDLPGPRIVFLNPAFTRMTGYAADEVIGKTPRLLQGPLTDKAVLKRLRQTLEKGEVFEGEAINYRKGGQDFDLEWQIAPIRDSEGVITHYVAIQRDVTEHKKLEARLLQSQKMETIGKLAGGVAHEFNSILTAIIGQSEYVIEKSSPDDPRAKSAKEIHMAAERAAGLTRQLLAYGRKQILQPEVIDLDQVLLQMRGTIEHLMGRNVVVRISSASDLKTIRIDPGQMEQVIINLVMNAADAMPNGGALTLETANVALDEDYVQPIPGLKPGSYVMLAISDTGCGMTDEVKARAFEPFFTTKAVGQGTGLGLSTCYGIIKQSNGHINLYSETARGTSFRVYLPEFQSTSAFLRPIPRSHDLPGGTETILLAEDDPALLEMTSSLLRRLGYIVHTAYNGVEALNLKNQRDIGPVHLLLTDLVMPHMSGKELAERIHAVYPETRILFTSAFTENAAIHQGILHEGIKLLQKPFTPSSLAKKVREILDANPSTSKP